MIHFEIAKNVFMFLDGKLAEQNEHLYDRKNEITLAYI